MTQINDYIVKRKPIKIRKNQENIKTVWGSEKNTFLISKNMREK